MALEVQVVESSFVTPSAATPREGQWLSSLDVGFASRGHTPTVYLYRPTASATVTNFSDVTVRLRESLAKALVAFYPFAGRLDVGDDGRIEINCNGEGVLFVVARSEATIDDFMDLAAPSTELRRRFVPRVEPPSLMLAIQVTFLKCGGILLGTALHHAATDGVGAFHFFQTWSAISRDGDGAPVELPCHDRTLLRGRSPPAVHPDAPSVFCPNNKLCEPRGPTVGRAFTISKDQIAALKHSSGGASTFCAVTALVWQCTCVARRLAPDAEARVSFSANARRGLRPPLPDRYFGNAIVALYAAGAARDVASEALELVAGRIRAAVARVDDELVRSAVDYYELFGSSPPVRGLCLQETELRVVSWLGLPVYDADFGWGKPWRMARAEPAPAGYVHLINNGPAADSGIRVIASLEVAAMEEFERLLYAKL